MHIERLEKNTEKSRPSFYYGSMSTLRAILTKNRVSQCLLNESTKVEVDQVYLISSEGSSPIRSIT